MRLAPAALALSLASTQPGCATLQQAFPGGFPLDDPNVPAEMRLEPQALESAPALLPRFESGDQLTSGRTETVLSELDTQCEHALKRPDHVYLHNDLEGDDFYIELFREGVRCACSQVGEVLACSAGPVTGDDRLATGTHTSLVFNEGSLITELSEQDYEGGQPVDLPRIRRLFVGLDQDAMLMVEHLEGMLTRLEEFLTKWQITCGSSDIHAPFTLETDRELTDRGDCVD